MSVKPIPDGYHSVTPYLMLSNASAAIDFYKKAFGALEIVRMEMGGRIGHAELKIGDSMIMLADDAPEALASSPKSPKESTTTFAVYLENVDAAFDKAVAAGGKVLRPIANQFYGDRSGTLADPFGHIWTLASHIEDVTPEEMKKRMAAMGGPS